MINGQIDLDALIHAKLTGIDMVDPATGAASVLPVVFGVPEEEVIERRQIPSLRVLYQYDHSLANRSRVQDQPELMRLIDETHPELGWYRLQTPLFRRWTYLIDMYTHSYRDMLELSRRLFARLRREYGYLVDDDGNEIIYRLDAMTDSARRIQEERLFKRSFTFSFDAWVQEDDTPIGTVGRVDRIHIDYVDAQGQPLEDEWVLDPPPADVLSGTTIELAPIEASIAASQEEVGP